MKLCAEFDGCSLKVKRSLSSRCKKSTLTNPLLLMHLFHWFLEADFLARAYIFAQSATAQFLGHGSNRK